MLGDARSGQQKRERTDANVDRTIFVRSDRKLRGQLIEEQNINSGTLLQILTKDLGMRKIS